MYSVMLTYNWKYFLTIIYIEAIPTRFDVDNDLVNINKQNTLKQVLISFQMIGPKLDTREEMYTTYILMDKGKSAYLNEFVWRKQVQDGRSCEDT